MSFVSSAVDNTSGVSGGSNDNGDGGASWGRLRGKEGILSALAKRRAQLQHPSSVGRVSGEIFRDSTYLEAASMSSSHRATNIGSSTLSNGFYSSANFGRTSDTNIQSKSTHGFARHMYSQPNTTHRTTARPSPINLATTNSGGSESSSNANSDSMQPRPSPLSIEQNANCSQSKQRQKQKPPLINGKMISEPVTTSFQHVNHISRTDYYNHHHHHHDQKLTKVVSADSGISTMHAPQQYRPITARHQYSEPKQDAAPHSTPKISIQKSAKLGARKIKDISAPFNVQHEVHISIDEIDDILERLPETWRAYIGQTKSPMLSSATIVGSEQNDSIVSHLNYTPQVSQQPQQPQQLQQPQQPQQHPQPQPQQQQQPASPSTVGSPHTPIYEEMTTLSKSRDNHDLTHKKSNLSLQDPDDSDFTVPSSRSQVDLRLNQKATTIPRRYDNPSKRRVQTSHTRNYSRTGKTKNQQLDSLFGTANGIEPGQGQQGGNRSQYYHQGSNRSTTDLDNASIRPSTTPISAPPHSPLPKYQSSSPHSASARMCNDSSAAYSSATPVSTPVSISTKTTPAIPLSTGIGIATNSKDGKDRKRNGEAYCSLSRSADNEKGVWLRQRRESFGSLHSCLSTRNSAKGSRGGSVCNSPNLSVGASSSAQITPTLSSASPSPAVTTTAEASFQTHALESSADLLSDMRLYNSANSHLPPSPSRKPLDHHHNHHHLHCQDQHSHQLLKADGSFGAHNLECSRVKGNECATEKRLAATITPPSTGTTIKSIKHARSAEFRTLGGERDLENDESVLGNEPKPDPRTAYLDLEEYAEGESGNVFVANSKRFGKQVAIKIIPKTAKPRYRKLRNELRIVRRMRSHNIVRFYEYFSANDAVWIVYEFMDKCSLTDILAGYPGLKLSSGLVAYVTREVLAGLTYLHDRRVVHCDMRSDNILINRLGQVKIADFSGAVHIPSDKQSVKKQTLGAVYWAAPELFKGEGYSTKTDIWALGAVVYEMMEGKPPYVEYPDLKVIELASTRGLPPLEDSQMWPHDIFEFASQCCDINFGNRPSASKLSKHSLLALAEKGGKLLEFISQVEVLDDEEDE